MLSCLRHRSCGFPPSKLNQKKARRGARGRARITDGRGARQTSECCCAAANGCSARHFTEPPASAKVGAGWKKAGGFARSGSGAPLAWRYGSIARENGPVREARRTWACPFEQARCGLWPSFGLRRTSLPCDRRRWTLPRPASTPRWWGVSPSASAWLKRPRAAAPHTRRPARSPCALRTVPGRRSAPAPVSGNRRPTSRPCRA